MSSPPTGPRLRRSRPGPPVSRGRALCAFLAAVFAGLALLAPAALAVPKAPALTGTVPPSPATSLSPAIKGRADGIITTVAPRSRAGRIIRTGSSTLTISIYEDSNCSGTPVAVGSGDQLEGPGIQAVVAPDSITTFFATATDAALNVSPCSNPGLVYQQVTSGPGPPSPSGVSPASPANDNTPRVSGSSPAGTMVKLYPGPTCTGTLLGSGSSTQFAAGGIQVTVPDDTTTTIYASASLAGVNSICSAASVTYREDSTPPRPPALTVLPGPRANDNQPRVRGSAPGATSVSIHDNPRCDGSPLAGGTPAELDAGFGLEVADNTTTDLYAIASDAAGNSSGCSKIPATYTEDSFAPRTRITLAPGVKTRRRTAVFRFLDATGEDGTSFLCKLDRHKWQNCRTPRKFRRLHYGRHRVRIRAIDAAGNRERVGAKRRFKVLRPRRHT